jgi:uncharacterized membrane protein YedE/YeeE
MAGAAKRAWSPYMVGAAIGILGVLTAVSAGKYLGASTSFARAAGGIVEAAAPEHYKGLPYYYDAAKRKETKYAFKIDWQLMLLCGVAVGALLASIGTREFRLKCIPRMWHVRFGKNVFLRWLIAFLGGALAMFGARMGGGCTSGHGVSGIMQLSVSGFVAIACFFVGGIITAKLMYHTKKPKAPEGGAQ